MLKRLETTTLGDWVLLESASACSNWGVSWWRGLSDKAPLNQHPPQLPEWKGGGEEKRWDGRAVPWRGEGRAVPRRQRQALHTVSVSEKCQDNCQETMRLKKPPGDYGGERGNFSLWLKPTTAVGLTTTHAGTRGSWVFETRETWGLADIRGEKSLSPHGLNIEWEPQCFGGGHHPAF